jgi:hypothetical protein
MVSDGGQNRGTMTTLTGVDKKSSGGFRQVARASFK